ncbi:MAG TPA: hypothetical protein ACFYDZ_00400 [Candidatus Brocadiaceae bacterium]
MNDMKVNVVKSVLVEQELEKPIMFEEILNTKTIKHSLMHDLKTMALDLEEVKEKYEILESKTNLLIIENDKLRLMIEDICFEQSRLNNNKARRQS